MKIAIDISPLDSGHKVRGVGFYLLHLKAALLREFPKERFTFFTKKSEISRTHDVIHFPYFDPFFLTLPFQVRHKSVITIHDLTPLVFPKAFPVGIKGTIKWHIQKKVLQGVGAVLTDSECSKKDIIRLTDIPSDRIHTIYLAAGEDFKKIILSDEEKRNILNKYHLPQKFGLYVGDATWNKNIPRLVKAVAEAGVPFVFVGKALAEDTVSENPWNNDLHLSQKMMKDTKNIHRVGFVPTEDLIKLYNIAEVFVMPSLYEGFGLSILEAMQSGCPVITSREGSIPEVAGDAAYFVDAYDVNSIRNGIMEVFSDSTVQEKLRKKGFIQAKKFSWRETAAKTYNVYKLVSKNE